MKLLTNMKIRNQMLLTLIIMMVLAVAVGVIGLLSMIHYNNLAQSMENASSRAVQGERVNSTVLSVVMDSRGIYMALNQDDVEKYAKPLLKNLEKIKEQMAEWQSLMPDDRKPELDAVAAKVDEFARYRAELVRLARVVSIAEGRAYGDNDANRSNRKALNDLIVDLAASNNEEVSAARKQMEDYYVEQRMKLILILAVALPLVVFLTLLIVLRVIVRPIKDMTDVMGNLAAGDLSVTIPSLGNKNEIGDMAGAVEVFRQGLIDAKAMSEAEKEQQAAKERRVMAMDKLIKNFDTGIEGVLDTISAASTELEQTAQSLSAMAEESSRAASSVAAASEEAATNVQAVAAAGEKMTASIQGIIREVADSRAASDRAASEAQETSRIAAGLIDATKKIDDVVVIIQDIASQTNLLALNATIEAARAGEMGKGFAVVANEVKNLATQTASSTEQIAEQVGSVQMVSTQVVEAIKKITDSIHRINEMSASVTDTMAAQGQMTEEIAANIVEASHGTKEVTVNISHVSQGAEETGNSAHQLLDAAKDIARQSVMLRDQVGSFLKEIKSL
jgi:methyl-accepting chemotaxis protein